MVELVQDGLQALSRLVSLILLSDLADPALLAGHGVRRIRLTQELA